MKKIVWIAATAALLGVSLTSCGGNKTQNGDAESADTTGITSDAENAASTAADEMTSKLDAALAQGTGDPEKVKTVLADIRKKVDELTASGQSEAAAAYASKLKSYIESHADELKRIDPSTLSVLDAVNAAANLPESVKKGAEKALDAAKQAGSTAAENAKNKAVETASQAVENAKNDAKTTAEKAKADAKAKANEAAANAQKKANQAIQHGAEKAASALGKALGGE